jgi:hypothetical protein
LLTIRTVDDAKTLVTWLAGEDADVVLARSVERVQRVQEGHEHGHPYFARSTYGAVRA